MQALRRRFLVTTICLAVSVFLSTGVSYARTSSSKVKAKKITIIEKVKVGAELEPCGAVAPATSPCDSTGTPLESDAEGTAGREKQSRNGVVQKDEFKGKLKIPVDPGSLLGMIDELAAEGADIRMILSRDDGTGLFTDFAECRLVFDEIEVEDEAHEEDSEAYAEYKVDVRIKKGSVQAKKGVCDVNLTNVDETGNAIIDSGIPDAQANDVASATLVDPTETDKNPADRTLDVDFLQGTFVSH